MHSFPAVIGLVLSEAVLSASLQASAPTLQGQTLVDTALANELRAVQDLSHPMRYLLRKSSPRLTTTRQIYETREGGVARLIATADTPLSATDEQKEQARLAALANDPARQRHRKQSEDADRARVAKVLRLLPNAFLYQYAGTASTADGAVEKFTFRPNPSFSPPDIETQVLTEMAGEIWIDVAQRRVVRLEGHLQEDVDFGWGILGRLYKGGWIRIEQTNLGGGQWRIARFQMVMNARVVWKTRNFDTIEEESQFAPLPPSLTYKDAIAMMRAEQRAAR